MTENFSAEIIAAIDFFVFTRLGTSVRFLPEQSAGNRTGQEG